MKEDNTEKQGLINGFFAEFFNEPDFDIGVFIFDGIVIAVIIGGIILLWKSFS